MGIVDRINGVLLRHIRSRSIPAIASAAEGAALAESIERIERLAAVLNDGFVGETMMLIADLKDGRILRTDENDPQWTTAITALDRSGRTRMTSTQWRLHLVSDERRAPIILIG